MMATRVLRENEARMDCLVCQDVKERLDLWAREANQVHGVFLVTRVTKDCQVFLEYRGQKVVMVRAACLVFQAYLVQLGYRANQDFRADQRLTMCTTTLQKENEEILGHLDKKDIQENLETRACKVRQDRLASPAFRDHQATQADQDFLGSRVR